MITLLIAALMWLLVVSLLILRRGRAARNITYAAVTIAIATTLNTDEVYRVLDGLAGGSNGVTLVADVTLMVGIFFLGRGVMKASEHPSRIVRPALGRVTLSFALIATVGTFLLIDRGVTTTSFMLDLGGQPAAAVYSMIQFTYYGVVLAVMATLASRQLRSSKGVQKWPPASVLLGSTSGVALSLLVVTMDVAHVVGNLSFMATVAVAYEPLHLLTFVFLCLGFAGQPGALALQARSRVRQTRMLVDELTPLWAEATKVRPGISQVEREAFTTNDPETLLHRHVVEIRDAMIDTRASFDVSAQERQLVERAERHLLGPGSASGSVPVASVATTGRARQK